jgi:hypothetical protein
LIHHLSRDAGYLPILVTPSQTTAPGSSGRGYPNRVRIQTAPGDRMGSATGIP